VLSTVSPLQWLPLPIHISPESTFSAKVGTLCTMTKTMNNSLLWRGSKDKYSSSKVRLLGFWPTQIPTDGAIVSRSSATSLTSVDVKVFRHEFISIFRYDGTRSFHPADLRILEVIDSNSTRYEEENETVFLSRDVMDRISKLSDPRRSMMMMQCQPRRTHAHSQRTRQR